METHVQRVVIKKKKIGRTGTDSMRNIFVSLRIVYIRTYICTSHLYSIPST